MICYNCEAETEWLADDSRCGKCTRLTVGEIVGEATDSEADEEDDVVTYADLIEDQEIAVELAMLASTPYSPRWGELIDQHGEAKLISLGAAI